MSDSLRIGDWTLETQRGVLVRGVESIHLEPKATEVLAYLAGRPGAVVGREELLSAVWPGVVVGDDALTQAIIKLRKALGDDAQQPRYIETIPKRGYRLVASVAPAHDAASPAPAPSLPSPRRRAWIVATVGIGLLVVLLLAWTRARMPWPIGADPHVAAESAVPVVAVLPFGYSGEPRREYLGDGITEDIISGLGRFSGLRVMSRNAVQGFKGRAAPPEVVRDQLKARYVVLGAVRELDGRLRVSVELSDAQKGVLLWSERFDGAGLDLLEIQDRIVRSIVASLRVRLTQIEQRRAFSRPTDSLEAYDLVLRARALLARVDRVSNREARVLLEQALKLAPDFGDALVYLGEAEIQRALFGWVEDPSVAIHRAEELALRVLASPDSNSHARAHLLLARFHSNMGRAEEARKHADRALEANPADPDGLYWKGVGLLYVGRLEESVAAMEEARRYDPELNAASAVNLAVGYFMVGRYGDAIALADVYLARTPRDVSLHAVKAASFARLGDLQAARESAAQVRRFNPYYQTRFAGERFARAEDRLSFRSALLEAGL
jgi:TolB-like protein/DNA-binding winged helix-turn-helix (wHTH) protein/Flp pilus assembly protein TadD